MKKKDFLDIFDHIMRTIDCGATSIEGLKKVDDISKLTNNHYNGPGYVYSFDMFDESSTEEDFVIFDSNKNYVGTRSDTWFNDIDPRWFER